MAFPTVTTLIDNFNRADENPVVSPFAAFAIHDSGSPVALKIDSNALAGQFLNGNGFLPSPVLDQDNDIQWIIKTPPATDLMDLFFNLQNLGVAGWTGCVLEYYATFSTWSFKKHPAAGPSIEIAFVTLPTLAAGDSVGVECRGSLITCYHKPVAGAWTQFMQVMDLDIGAMDGGAVGFSMGDTALRIDQVNGGSVNPPDFRYKATDSESFADTTPTPPAFVTPTQFVVVNEESIVDTGTAPDDEFALSGEVATVDTDPVLDNWDFSRWTGGDPRRGQRSMITLTVDGKDWTNIATGLGWTSVDPGGYETCTFQIPDNMAPPREGAPIVIREGLEVCWMGRVEESGEEVSPVSAPTDISGVGAGVILKDAMRSMIFMDKDLGRWQGASVRRQLQVGPGWAPQTDGSIASDSVDPALKFEVSGEISGGSGGISEAWYDGGANIVGGIYFDTIDSSNLDGDPGNWIFNAYEEPDDVAGGGAVLTPDIVDDAALGQFNPTSLNPRWLILQLAHFGPYTTDALTRWRTAKNITVIGNHGIHLTDMKALPTDVVQWIYDQAGLDTRITPVSPLVASTTHWWDGIFDPEGTPDTNEYEQSDTTFSLMHLVYYDEVPLEQMVDDVSKLMGWHWGVWGPESVLGEEPVAYFAPPPSEPTAFCAASDTLGFKLARRLSDYYNRALVKYQDATGKGYSVTRTLKVSRLPAGISRTLEFDIGLSTQEFAESFGDSALLLQYQQARAAGSCTLPLFVDIGGGGKRAAHTLRPGLDRIKISELSGLLGAWTDADSRRLDAFRISRLSAVRDSGGHVTTQIELDAGMNLIEVLQARLAIRSTVS